MQGSKGAFSKRSRQTAQYQPFHYWQVRTRRGKATVDVAKRLAEVLDTTVGFLMGESMEMNVLKDPGMLRRLNDLVSLPQKDKDGILYALDGLLRDAKTRLTYQ